MGPEVAKQAAGSSGSAAALERGLLQGFLEDIEAAGIQYVVAGNPTGLPAVSGDVDIVVGREDFDALLGAVDIWFGDGRTLVQTMRHESRAAAFVIATTPWRGLASLEILQLDVCADYVRNARELLPAAWLLDGRRLHTAPDGGFRAWVPAPEAAFTYYLVKKIAKRSANEAAFRYLVQMLLEVDSFDEVKSVIGERLASEASTYIEAGDLATFNAQLPRLNDLLMKRSPRRLASVVAEASRVLGRLSSPTGLVVEVHGPKQAQVREVAARLASGLRRAFRRTAIWGTPAAPVARAARTYALLRASTLVVETHVGGARTAVSRRAPAAMRLAVEVGYGEGVEEAVDRTAPQVLDHLARRQRQRMG